MKRCSRFSAETVFSFGAIAQAGSLLIRGSDGYVSAWLMLLPWRQNRKKTVGQQ